LLHAERPLPGKQLMSLVVPSRRPWAGRRSKPGFAHVAKNAKATLDVEKLDVVADRGYFNSEEILACEQAGITVTLPKPMTSNSKAQGRSGLSGILCVRP
jgi:hypothetical protein